jgi:hypothetical protein
LNLQWHPPDSTAAAVTLTISVLVALAFGVARGLTTRVWDAGAIPMRQGTRATLVLWIGAIAVRLAIGIIARRAGVAVNVTTREIPIFLAITLAVQMAPRPGLLGEVALRHRIVLPTHVLLRLQVWFSP